MNRHVWIVFDHYGAVVRVYGSKLAAQAAASRDMRYTYRCYAVRSLSNLKEVKR